ncbi:MAG: hypothetical protein ACP5R2_09240, partial [Anaerolineae bacterium]
MMAQETMRLMEGKGEEKMVRWRDEREDDFERDWWDRDDEEEGSYWPDPYGRSPYGWPTIMGMPYPIAIDIMRGKWPS